MDLKPSTRKESVRRVPAMLANKVLGTFGWELRRCGADRDFTTDDFRRREVFRENYYQLGRALSEVLGCRRVLDIGSGNGFLIDALLCDRVEIDGIELSESVRPLLSSAALKRTRFADATLIGKVGDYDLVTCIEVAEHIPPNRSEALADVLACNATDWIYLTAATPYQPGHGHTNCRPHFFWLKLLHERGFDLDLARTSDLLSRITGMQPCEWLPNNSLLFRSRERRS